MINRTTNLWIATALLGLLLLCAPLNAQQRPQQLIVPLTNGGFVAFQAQSAYSAPNKAADNAQAQALFDSQALIDDKQIIHRVLVDTEGKPVFGYDLFVSANSPSKQFTVAARPLDQQFESRLLARTNGPAAAAKIATLPQSSEPQLLDDGDAFSLDLLINPTAGMKIIDVVKVSFDRSTLWNSSPKSLPRDFTLEAVQLALKEYQLVLNDKVVAKSKSKIGCAGALVWFYIPEHGRYIFSLVPRDGYEFQKVGTVAGNKIDFTMGGDHFEWISSTPIMSDGGTWNLWVLHDPAYVPVAAIPPADKGKDPWDKIDAAVNAAKDEAARLRNKQATFQRQQEQERAKNRPTVMAGGADRIENLMPPR